MTRRKQVMLALLSLILLALLVIGVLLGQRFLLSFNPKSDHTMFKIDKTDKGGVSSVEVAEKAVSLLEDKQTSETLKVAKEAVNRLAQNKEKSSLMARISVVEAKLQNKEVEAEAERAVAYLEGHPDLSNISLAQELIVRVTNPGIKKGLEERVRLVQESLNSQNVAQTAPANNYVYETSNESTTTGTYVPTPVQPSSPSVPIVTPTQPEPLQSEPFTPTVEVPDSSESISFSDSVTSASESNGSENP